MDGSHGSFGPANAVAFRTGLTTHHARGDENNRISSFFTALPVHTSTAYVQLITCLLVHFLLRCWEHGTSCVHCPVPISGSPMRCSYHPSDVRSCDSLLTFSQALDPPRGFDPTCC